MSISQTYIFDASVNFNSSNAEVDETNDVGKLALENNSGQHFIQDFANDTGFTYDPLKAEFVGGVVRQKSQAPTGVLFAGDFVTKDLTWSTTGGSLVGTLTGAPTIVGGKLVTTGNQGVSYVHTSKPVSSFKFKWTPNYTGGPVANTQLMATYNKVDNKDKFYVMHSGVGSIRFALWNNLGASVLPLTAVFTPANVAGVEAEYEIVLNSTLGTIRFFREGVLVSTTNVAPWARGGVTTNVQLGASAAGYSVSQASFDDLMVFENAQHTASYTAGYTVPTILYAETKVDLPPFTYGSVGVLQSIGSSVFTESGTPRYIIDGMYWDGAAWVASDNSYSQANTSADVNTNLPSLVSLGTTTILASVVFANGIAQSSVDNLDIEYIGQRYIANGYLEPIQPIQVSSIFSYVQVLAAIPVNTQLGIILKIDGVLKWYNTVSLAWETSNGTIAQTNTATEISDNVASLSFSSNTSVYPRWVMNTADGLSTPEITIASIAYDFGGVSISPATCLVYGYLKDMTGAPIGGVKITFNLHVPSNSFYKEANHNVISTQTVTVTADSLGYFEVTLVRSSEYESGASYGIAINFKNVSDTDNGLSFDVPDSDVKDITELLQSTSYTV